jgi:hypothetical protein
MCTPEEIAYLATLDPSELVDNSPFDSERFQLGQEIVGALQKRVPHLRVLLTGALALRISGQNDIDVCVLCGSDRFDVYLPILRDMLGQEASKGATSVRWEPKQWGPKVTVYLTDPNVPAMDRQLSVQTILICKPELLSEYDRLKAEAAPLGLREYQRTKYEFYNDILRERDLSQYADAKPRRKVLVYACLLYTSDAADDM